MLTNYLVMIYIIREESLLEANFINLMIIEIFSQLHEIIEGKNYIPYLE